MRVRFLGVGEACDERYPNTSLLTTLKARGGHPQRLFLLDCGFTVPPQFWRYCPDPEALDGIWVSHFHGDHFMGLPALLLRFWEMSRAKPLTILGRKGIRDVTERVMDLAYPGIRKKLAYSLEFVEVDPGEDVQVLGCRWRAAVTGHGELCLAVRLDGNSNCVFYSGDGAPSRETRELADGCELIVHEAFSVKEELVVGHGTVKGCIEFAEAVKTNNLAVVHIQRDVRQHEFQDIEAMLAAVRGFKVMIPEPGDVIDLV